MRVDSKQRRRASGLGLKGIATVPTAFLAGFGGLFDLFCFGRWASSYAVRPTWPLSTAVLVVFFVVPFLLLVLGVDRARWDPNYDWFDPTWKMEKRRMWIRSGAYFLGFVLATVIIPEIG